MEQKADQTDIRMIISKWILTFVSYSKNIHFARLFFFQAAHKETN